MREKLIELIRREAVPPFAERIADHLIENGVTIPVRCKKCKHWSHTEDGMGECTNARFHLPGHADPTMEMDGFCSCGERRNEEDDQK